MPRKDFLQSSIKANVVEKKGNPYTITEKHLVKPPNIKYFRYHVQKRPRVAEVSTNQLEWRQQDLQTEVLASKRDSCFSLWDNEAWRSVKGR